MNTPITKLKVLTIGVELPKSLWQINQASTVHSIAIDFDDGTCYIHMNFGGNYQLKYTQKGIYDWTYELTLSDGQILYIQRAMDKYCTSKVG